MTPDAAPPREYDASRSPKGGRWFPFVMTGFVVVLLCSNLIGPAKVCAIRLPFELPWGGRTISFGAGNLFFPISYIFGDVLTEVYGYARARKVIWAGFVAMGFATLMSWVVIHMPADSHARFNETLQPALVTVFGATGRIVAGSMIAFWAGDFVNSYVLAKMKVLTRGQWLWTRTIGSTIFGQAIDTLIFYPIAFFGIWETDTLLAVMGFNWVLKVGVEVVFTPVTYRVVAALKKAENEDHYDCDTNFSPFTLADQ